MSMQQYHLQDKACASSMRRRRRRRRNHPSTLHRHQTVHSAAAGKAWEGRMGPIISVRAKRARLAKRAPRAGTLLLVEHEPPMFHQFSSTKHASLLHAAGQAPHPTPQTPPLSSALRPSGALAG